MKPCVIVQRLAVLASLSLLCAGTSRGQDQAPTPPQAPQVAQPPAPTTYKERLLERRQQETDERARKAREAAQKEIGKHELITSGTVRRRSTSRVGSQLENYRLAWSDEFDGNLLDATKWGSYFDGKQGDGTVVADAVSVSNGCLTITTYTRDGQHFTGAVTTRGKVERRFGYVEARVRFADSPGMASAFGMEASSRAGRGNGMEVSSRFQPNQSQTASAPTPVQQQWYSWRGPTQTSGIGFTTTDDAELAQGFHVYGFEVTETASRFYVDGVLKHEEHHPVTLKPMSIFFASEVIGEGSTVRPHFGDMFGRPQLPLPAKGFGARELSPTKIVVDYVRWYESKSGVVSMNMTSGDYTYYTNTAGEATVSGFNKNYVGDLTIPESLNGCPIKQIAGKSFDNCQELTAVAFPTSTVAIGEQAFSGCNNLTNVVIQAGVTNAAFYKSPGFAFACSNLKALNVSAQNPTYSSRDGVLFNKEGTKLLFYPPGKVGRYSIPAGTVSVDDPKIWHTDGLTEISIPASVARIGTDMATGAIRGFPLVKVTVDAANETFCSIDGAVYDKAGQTLVLVPCGVAGAYRVSDGVTRIGAWAFSSCSELDSITFPSSVAAFDKTPFLCCVRLKRLYFEGAAPSPWPLGGSGGSRGAMIYYRAGAVGWGTTFGGLPTASWESQKVSPPVPLPDVLAQSTPLACFAYSTAGGGVTITRYQGTNSSVVIPAKVDEHPVIGIGDQAFPTLKNLAAVLIPPSVTQIATRVSAFTCEGLLAIHVDAANPAYSSIDGVLFNKEGTRLVRYPQGRRGAYRVPEGVTEIGDRAFDHNYWLTDIALPESVTNIGAFAFNECEQLTRCPLPSQLSVIGSSAFARCVNLQTVEIPHGVSKLGIMAFCGCLGLTDARLGKGVTRIGWQTFSSCGCLTNIVFPDGLTEIGPHAFSRCVRLPDISLPGSVTSIGGGALYGCMRLSAATIPASVTNVAASAFSDCPNLRVVRFEGDAPFVDKEKPMFSGTFNATIYYRPGTKGWGTTFVGRPTKEWKQ